MLTTIGFVRYWEGCFDLMDLTENWLWWFGWKWKGNSNFLLFYRPCAKPQYIQNSPMKYTFHLRNRNCNVIPFFYQHILSHIDKCKYYNMIIQLQSYHVLSFWRQKCNSGQSLLDCNMFTNVNKKSGKIWEQIILNCYFFVSASTECYYAVFSIGHW